MEQERRFYGQMSQYNAFSTIQVDLAVALVLNGTLYAQHTTTRS